MRILITGGSGLVGKSLLETAPKEYQIASTYNKNYPSVEAIWYRLDVRNRADIFDTFENFMPNIVMHCASIGSVDYTENNYSEVREVNVTGLGHIIDASNGYKSKVIYISSNAIFSGKNPPYSEKSPLEPVNSYGVIKREAERLVRDMANKWLIFRPFLLYGWPYPGGRTNWAKAIVEKLEGGGAFTLVNDHIWQPTFAPELAQVIWQLINEERQIYNVASPERATLYEFGLKVCDVFGLSKNLIKPAKSEFFVGLAERPHDTSYDLIKLSQLGIMLSDIKTGLEKMKEVRK